MVHHANHKSPAQSNFISAVCDPGKVAAKLRKNARSMYRQLPFDLHVELIASPNQIPILLEIEKKCFPSRMQDQRQDFEDFFEDEYACGLILYQENLPIGYMMGFHIHEANSARALETNEFVRQHQDRIFYMSNLSIIPENRSIIALKFLIHEMSGLLKSIDYDYFTAYVRKRYGLSSLLVRRLCGKVLFTEENWEDTGEAFDYCLVNLASIPTIPAWVDYLFTLARRIRRKLKRMRAKMAKGASA